MFAEDDDSDDRDVTEWLDSSAR